MSDHAKRAVIPIGSLRVDGFQMPSGDYWMSQASAAKAVNEPPVYALRFLRSKDAKALLRGDYTDYSIEVEDAAQERGRTRINALSLDIVSAYWLYRAHRGNKQALGLCLALMTETLERRFDAAFGVARRESERNAVLTQQSQKQERDLEALAETFAQDDVQRQQIEILEQQIRDLGGEPWIYPPPENREGE